jgi:two-component system, cell cycle sensor histidine kinase and response regulator CckA
MTTRRGKEATPVPLSSFTSDQELVEFALRSLYENNPEAVYLLGTDGRFIFGNDALLLRIGYSRDELEQIGYLPTVDSSDSEFVAAQFLRAIAGETVRYPATGVSKSGARFRAHVTNIPLRRNGEVVAVLGIARDLDELEGALRAQADLESRLEDTLNSISDGFILLDKDFRFTYLNTRAEEIGRYPAAELIGKVVWDVYPEMLGTELSIAYTRARDERVSVVAHEHYAPYDVYLEQTAYPAGDGIAVYIRDTTEEVHSQRALAENERKLADQAALLDVTRDAIIVQSVDHKLIYWNRAAQELYGWTTRELEANGVRDLLFVDPNEYDRCVAATLEAGAWVSDIRQTSKDGRLLTTACRMSLMRNEQGEPVSIFAVGTDVTEKRQLEEVKLRAERVESLGTLAGGIAHDLNNLLTPALLAAQLLAVNENDPTRAQTLEVLEGSLKRGASMIRQMLDFARGVEGRRIVVDTQRLLGEVERFCLEAVPAPITVKVRTASARRFVIGDPVQLSQVLVNLITNARDAMPDGGELTISVRHVDIPIGLVRRTRVVSSPGSYEVIEVEDTGTGMTESTAEKIFDPFFTTKPIGEGTGLGLSSSAAIVRSHGGDIHVSSRVGEGTRFEVYLPSAPARPSEAAAGDVDAAPIGKDQLVLIVDDELAIRHVARQILQANGYRTAVAANGHEALEYLDAFPNTVSLVFSDVMMPAMDGNALAEQLRQSHPDLPVLLTSGLVVKRGEIPFLPKPYATNDLLIAVAAAIGN